MEMTVVTESAELSHCRPIRNVGSRQVAVWRHSPGAPVRDDLAVRQDVDVEHPLATEPGFTLRGIEPGESLKIRHGLSRVHGPDVHGTVDQLAPASLIVQQDAGPSASFVPT